MIIIMHRKPFKIKITFIKNKKNLILMMMCLMAAKLKYYSKVHFINIIKYTLVLKGTKG